MSLKGHFENNYSEIVPYLKQKDRRPTVVWALQQVQDVYVKSSSQEEAQS